MFELEVWGCNYLVIDSNIVSNNQGHSEVCFVYSCTTGLDDDPVLRILRIRNFK